MKKLIVLAGPTASGKTELALQLALYYNCPIISADSRQIYKEFDIAVARPSAKELATAPHYFIASHSIESPLSAGAYEKEAIALLEQIYLKHDFAILCGGSGLFIKAVLQGFSPAPPANQKLREELNIAFDTFGIVFLQNKLREIDPGYFDKAEINNPQRLIRAIEMASNSELSVTEIKKPQQKKRSFTPFLFCLDWPRDILYERINKRVDKMLTDGIEEEARRLLPYKGNIALKTVGYTEFFLYFEKEINKERCIELLKQNTRRFAKRQVTWFRHQGAFEFINPPNAFAHITALIAK